MPSEHYPVTLLSFQWWLGLFIATAFIAVPLVLLRNKNATDKIKFGKFIGIFLLLLAIAIHIYEAYYDQWHLRSSLPLQLCALSGILSGMIFFIPQQLLFEFLIYWGFPGAVHSLLTPEMSHGYSPFLYLEYYLAHAGIILACLYLLVRMDFTIRKNSWIRVFLLTQLFILGIGIINYFIDANYMYLCQKPIAPNPFVIGDWPWYVIGLEIAGILHFYLVYFILNKSGKVRAV